MSLTETPADRITPRRKTKKRQKRAAAAPKPTAELAGITATNCPAACNVNGCIISGKPYCAHPFKGGLQGMDMRNDASLGKLNAAKKTLGKAKINIEKL